jgi:hypothetical protein
MSEQKCTATIHDLAGRPWVTRDNLGCNLAAGHDDAGWHHDGTFWWHPADPESGGATAITTITPEQPSTAPRSAEDGQARTPGTPGVPQAATAALDDVRERLAHVRVGRRMPGWLLGSGSGISRLTLRGASGDEEWVRAAEADQLRRELADLTREYERLRAELAAVRDAPLVRRHADGSLSVDWADGQVSCLISRVALDGVLLERATLRAQVDELRRLLGEALDLALRNMRIIPEPLTGSTWATPPDPAALARSREDMAELLRIRREAGLT